MCEVIREQCHSAKKVVAVIDSSYVGLVEEQWRSLENEMAPLQRYFEKPPPKNDDTFLEFVEKQVIFDSLLDPFLTRNFILYDAFPFSADGFFSNESSILNVF